MFSPAIVTPLRLVAYGLRCKQALRLVVGSSPCDRLFALGSSPCDDGSLIVGAYGSGDVLFASAQALVAGQAILDD